MYSTVAVATGVAAFVLTLGTSGTATAAGSCPTAAPQNGGTPDWTLSGTTGSVAVMRQALEAARMGWGLCTVCGVAGRGETLDVVPRLLITGRRVCGSSFGGLKGRDDVPALVDRYLAGEIDVDPFISHRLRLGDINHGFELMEAQDGIRSVIQFN